LLATTCRHRRFAFCVPEGAERVLNFCRSTGQHPSHDLEARFALLLVDRAGVNIKRCAATGMTHQFLSNFDVDTERP
jgi:hypothetical protein